MNIPNPTILRKALAIKTELEELDRKLEELLLKDSSQDTVRKGTAKSSKEVKRFLSNTAEETLHDDEKKTQEQIPFDSAEALHEVEQDNAEQPTTSEPETYHDIVVQHDVVEVFSSLEPHQETLLLLDDDGQEELTIIPIQDNHESDTPVSSEENPHCAHGCDHPSYEG